MKNLSRNKKALSPVIATVILVAVTIVVAVSVAYWMGSLAGGYTAFEQIELPTVYASYDASLFTNPVPPPANLGGWKVSIELKNTGSADATIDNIFLNAKPLKEYNPTTTDIRVKLYKIASDGTETLIDLTKPIDIKVGKGGSAKIRIEILDKTTQGVVAVEGCTSGTRVDLKLHTAQGKTYPAQVVLP